MGGFCTHRIQKEVRRLRDSSVVAGILVFIAWVILTAAGVYVVASSLVTTWTGSTGWPIYTCWNIGSAANETFAYIDGIIMGLLGVFIAWISADLVEGYQNRKEERLRKIIREECKRDNEPSK